jgi:assimilatory nitrate reductase catalytic subunit
MLRLTTRRGSAVMKARLCSTIRMDTLFSPFHGGAGRVNVLTNPALEPVSKMPEFKVCAARIDKQVEESPGSGVGTGDRSDLRENCT